jgi:hypothetical protein
VKILAVVFSSALALDQNSTNLPAYKLLRYEEDWIGLRDRGARSGWIDSFKHIPFGRREGWYLTLGGDVRERFEYFNQAVWAREAGDNKYWLQQYNYELLQWGRLWCGKHSRLDGFLRHGIWRRPHRLNAWNVQRNVPEGCVF